MPDKNLQAIVDALDVLARGASTKTNGKLTSLNLAKEAGVSKATLYRYIKEFPDLNDTFAALRRNGIRLTEEVTESIHDAYRHMKQEVKALRAELSRVKNDSAKLNELKSHQIQLLWMENERLLRELTRLKGLGEIRFIRNLNMDDSIEKPPDELV